MKGRTMLLPKESIIEFQEIFQKEFGVVITTSQAKQKAEDFIQLFDLISKKQKQLNKSDIYEQA